MPGSPSSGPAGTTARPISDISVGPTEPHTGQNERRPCADDAKCFTSFSPEIQRKPSRGRGRECGEGRATVLATHRAVAAHHHRERPVDFVSEGSAEARPLNAHEQISLVAATLLPKMVTVSAAPQERMLLDCRGIVRGASPVQPAAVRRARPGQQGVGWEQTRWGSLRSTRRAFFSSAHTIRIAASTRSLAPPLGVWRLAGVLRKSGACVRVFDPNCVTDTPPLALERELRSGEWDVVGISTTGMTLRFDLELAHLTRKLAPQALMVAGGMEATFRPELMFELGPFDLVVLGEGERPMLEIAARLREGRPMGGVAGTAERARGGAGVLRLHQRSLDHDELRDAIFSTPYEDMPYEAYWQRLEAAYRVGALPVEGGARGAARGDPLRPAHHAELLPDGLHFCSATNFLHESQGGVGAIARLDADEALQMIERIVAAHPQVRTIIFQDDIFVFTKDRRVLPLCEGIVAAKARGRIPANLQFISTNRIDAMSVERLQRDAPRRLPRARLRHRKLLARRARRVQQGADPSAHRAHARCGARRGHHAVPRSHPELARVLAGGCGEHVARSAPLAACADARSACIRT